LSLICHYFTKNHSATLSCGAFIADITGITKEAPAQPYVFNINASHIHTVTASNVHCYVMSLTPLLMTCHGARSAVLFLVKYLDNQHLHVSFNSTIMPKLLKKRCEHNTSVVNSSLVMSQMLEFCYLQMQYLIPHQ